MTEQPASRLRIYPLGVKVLAALVGVIVALLIVLYIGDTPETIMQRPVVAALAMGLVLLLSVWDLVAGVIAYLQGETT